MTIKSDLFDMLAERYGLYVDSSIGKEPLVYLQARVYFIDEQTEAIREESPYKSVLLVRSDSVTEKLRIEMGEDMTRDLCAYEIINYDENWRDGINGRKSWLR